MRTTEADATAEVLTSRIEYVDSVKQRMVFDGKDMLEPVAAGSCFLRFTMYQGSLFAYRWTEVGGR